MKDDDYRYAVMPYNPVEDRWYINAIGENVIEASANLSPLCLSDDTLEILIFVKVKISDMCLLEKGEDLAHQRHY